MDSLQSFTTSNLIENFQQSNMKFKMQIVIACFVPFFIYFTFQQFYQFYINIYYHRKIRQVLKQRQVQIDEFVDKYKNSVDKQTQEYILSCNLGQLQESLRQFKITSEQILITYALRAVTIGAQLNLIADINLEDNIKQARFLDEQRKLIKDQSILPEIYGIPMSVKDHITCKGLRYTGGMAFSLDLQKAEVDCNFVSVLKEQGAIFYCSSNVPQGMGAIESSSRMWGKSLNPWNQERTTGGSSGGEAGLISARCSPIGIGSDAAGSIRIPSSFCGTYGFAPSSKRISLKRTVNLRKYDLHYWREIGCSYGPMGKCVDDLNIMCRSVFGKFKNIDSYTPDLPWDEKKYQDTLKSKNLRIGYIVDDPFAESHPAQQNVINEVVEFLRAEGHEMIEIKDNWTERFLITGMPIMQAHGMASNLEKTLRGEYPKKYYTLQVILSKFPSFVVRFFGRCAEYIGENRMGKILKQMKNRNLNDFFQEVYKKELLIDEFTDFYKTQLKLDSIIAPVLPYPAIKHGTAEIIQGLMGSTFTYNIMCMPSGFVPVRKIQKNEQYYKSRFNDMAVRRIKKTMEGSEGLPVGVQVAAFTYEDEICLGVMKKIENRYQFHEYPDV